MTHIDIQLRGGVHVIPEKGVKGTIEYLLNTEEGRGLTSGGVTAICLSTFTMEQFKAELCPDSRHLDSIKAIKIHDVPIVTITMPDLGLEGKVFWA